MPPVLNLKTPGVTVSEVLSGVLPVLATPFTENGDLDTASLASEIDFVIDQKAHGVVLGMVSD